MEKYCEKINKLIANILYLHEYHFPPFLFFSFSLSCASRWNCLCRARSRLVGTHGSPFLALLPLACFSLFCSILTPELHLMRPLCTLHWGSKRVVLSQFTRSRHTHTLHRSIPTPHSSDWEQRKRVQRCSSQHATAGLHCSCCINV